MLHKRSFASLVVASVLSACGSSPPADPDSGPIVLEDSGPAACGPPGENPTPAYGTTVGRTMTPFELTRCDGTPFEFYGEEEGFCDSRLTVILMSAGWCVPCRMEAELLEDRIIQPYGDRGVRVVQALMQDNDYGAPTGEFCQGWVDQYGLTNPVVMDPEQVTQRYFPDDSIPGTLIVDSRGVVRHREYGVSTNLRTITAKLDELLAEAP